MKIAFHLNDFSNRGSEVAIFDYAINFEKTLKGKAIILAPHNIRYKADHNGIKTYDKTVEEKYKRSFGDVYLYNDMDDLDRILEEQNCMALYVLKSGEKDGIESKKFPTFVHCVFICNKDEKHGTVYAAISEEIVGKYYGREKDKDFEAPVVPHICDNVYEFESNSSEFREIYNIPDDAIIFGRYGGLETFDIDFVKEIIKQIAEERTNIYFVFMNTTVFIEHPRVIYLKPSIDKEVKKWFVNATDAMLHGRKLGESFGLAIAEFCEHGKPIFTYKDPKEPFIEHRAHHQILGCDGVYYSNAEELKTKILCFKKGTTAPNSYIKFTIPDVMLKFQSVFLGLNEYLKKIVFDKKYYYYFKGDSLGESLETGGWELNVSSVIDTLSDLSGTFIDIGANIGYHCIRLADKFKNTIAVEPHPLIREVLNKNIKVNNLLMTVIESAFGDDEYSSFLPNVKPGCCNMGILPLSNSGVYVNVVKLDDHKELQKLERVDVIKIDCSGNEYQVLCGAKSSIEKWGNPYIIISVENGVNKYNPKDLFNTLINEMGYKVYAIDSGYMCDHLAVPSRVDISSMFDISQMGKNYISNSHEYGVTEKLTPFTNKLTDTTQITTTKVYPMCNYTSCYELRRIWSKMRSKTDEIEFTDDISKADYYFIVNKPPQGEYFEPSKTIVARMEPDEDTAPHWNDWYDNKTDFLAFMSHNSFYNTCEWNVSKNAHDIRGVILKDKELENVIGTTISDQQVAEGHKLRIDFVKYLQKNNVKIDVYGRGNPGFTDHKGELPYHEKDKSIFPYKYVFNAENIPVRNYLTEKIFDPILGECLTFYWGCPNVDEFIDSRAYIILDLKDKEGSMKIVRDAIENDEWGKRLPYIIQAKHRILDYLSFFPRLSSIIKTQNMKKVVVNLDRRPDRWDTFVKNAEGVRLKNYERFQAVDGNGPEADEYKKMISIESTPQMQCPGVIGCLGSHMKIWKECMEGNKPYLVLEDDTTFTERFSDKLALVYSELETVDKEWDVCFIGYHINDKVEDLEEYIHDLRGMWSRQSIFNFTTLCLKFQSFYPPFGFVAGGTYGYLLSPVGAKKLFYHTHRTGLIFPVDYHMMCLSKTNIAGPGQAEYIYGDVNMYLTTRKLNDSVIFSEDSDIDITPYTS